MTGLFFRSLTIEDITKIRNGTHPKWIECDDCHGYGSSLKEDASKCTKCGGKGFIERVKF